MSDQSGFYDAGEAYYWGSVETYATETEAETRAALTAGIDYMERRQADSGRFFVEYGGAVTAGHDDVGMPPPDIGG